MTYINFSFIFPLYVDFYISNCPLSKLLIKFSSLDYIVVILNNIKLWASTSLMSMIYFNIVESGKIASMIVENTEKNESQ